MHPSGLPIVNKSVQRQFQQRGFSLLEILAALALGMLMMASLTAMVDTTLQDTKGQQTAQYQAQFTAAALRYLNDNAGTLQTSVSASPGSTIAVNLATLKPVYLPAAFAPKNAYGQEPCLLVRGTATPNQFDALVVTEGGDGIPPKDIGYVAANAGTGGGSIRLFDTDVPTSPIVAEGAFRAWQLDQPTLSKFTTAKCSTTSFAGVGNLASLLPYGGPNAINRDVLFRKLTPSDPTLNQMNVPLGFSTSAMQTVGSSPCTPYAITLETGTGDILKCNTTTNQWENSASRFWKDPVANYLALANVSPPPQDGDVHMTLDYGRAYMFKSGVWLPLALDQNGDLNMTNPGNIKVSNGSITVSNGNVDIPVGTLSAKNVAATLDITAANNITATQTVKGNVVYASAAVVSQSLSPTLKYFTAGDGCNYPGFDSTGAPVTYLAYGTIVSDVTGLIMECQVTAAPPAPGSPAGSTGAFIYVDGTSQTKP